MDPQRCIGCHACEMACAECETNGQTPMVSVDYVDRYYTPQTSVQICMHCEDPRAPRCARRRDSERRVRHRSQRQYRLLHLLLELRVRVSVWRPKGRADAAHDQMQHVLRPHQRGQKADVRHRSVPAARSWYGTREKMRELRPNSTPVNTFRFGKQSVKTKVNVMMPKGAPNWLWIDTMNKEIEAPCRRSPRGSPISHRPRRGPARVAARVCEIPSCGLRRACRRERLGRRA